MSLCATISSTVWNGKLCLETVRKAIRLPLNVAMATMQYIHQKPMTKRPDCARGRSVPPARGADDNEDLLIMLDMQEKYEKFCLDYADYVTFRKYNQVPNIVWQWLQARSKQCLIGPAITKLSAGDLGAGRVIFFCTSIV